MPNQKTHISNLRMGTMFYMCPAVVLKAQVGPNSDSECRGHGLCTKGGNRRTTVSASFSGARSSYKLLMPCPRNVRPLFHPPPLTVSTRPCTSNAATLQPALLSSENLTS